MAKGKARRKAKRKAKARRKAQRTAQRKEHAGLEGATVTTDTPFAADTMASSPPVVDVAPKRSGIRKPVIKALHREMNRESFEGLTGWSGTALNPQMPDGHKFVLLMRAAGDVAEALSAPDKDSTALYRHCLHTGAVALAWAQSLHPRQGARSTQWVSS